MGDAEGKSVTKVRILEKFLGPRLTLRTVPLLVMLGLFVAADVLIAAIVDVRGDHDGGFVLGVIFAQVVPLAVWTALGPARLITRIVMGVCGTVLVALTLVACIGSGGPEVWMFLVIVFAQWIVVQFPLWIFRLFGWRLCWPGQQIASSQRELQFGISQLMIWMALFGITLGIGRLLLPDDLRGSRSPPEAVIIVIILTVYNCLLAWPVVWSSLAPRWWWLWLIATGLCCLGLTFAEVITFRAAMGQQGNEDVFWNMNYVQVGAATAALLAMRIAGFRLLRGGSPFKLPV